jgi:hypothetical protein
MTNLVLESSAFSNGEEIPKKYGYKNGNVSPPLKIGGIPSGTQSLVLIMDDPDALKPAGKVWDHWIVFNIPPEAEEIPEAQEPQGVQGITSLGGLGYGGPCPPDAEHKYIFKLYALDTELNLNEGVTKVEVETAMQGHIIEKTELIGRYERQ